MPTTTINETTIAYETHGAGQPILFLHGIFVSRQQWQGQVAHFAPHYNVITCDLRGHGQSGMTADPYSVELFAADVVGLLDKLGLERVVCCGHSFGGMVAQELALSHPERVQGLILVESSYGVSSTPWEASTAYWFNLWLPQMLGHKNYAQMMTDYFAYHTPEARPYIRREVDQYLDDIDNGDNIIRASLRYNSRWRLHQLRCPTLIMLGQYYHLPWIVMHSWEMWWRIPGATMRLIPGAGHLLYWDNPAAFHREVEAFLAQVS